MKIESTSIYSTQKAKQAQQVVQSPPNSIWETKLNERIEPTKQSKAENTGNCYLLSYINSLSASKWGAKIIDDAIEKDEKGGAIIHFKGAKGEQKEYKVSAEEIVKARESGRYSSGDDDMIAFELAFEKYFKAHGEEHGRTVNQNVKPGEILMASQGFTARDFLEVLTGEKYPQHVFMAPDTNNIAEIEDYKDNIKDILTEIEKHPNEYLTSISFNHDWMGMLKEHAYSIKGVTTDTNGEKYVILTNPHDSSKEEKVKMNLFLANVNTLELIEDKNAEPNPKVKMYSQRGAELAGAFGELFDRIRKDEDIDSDLLKRITSNLDKENIKKVISDYPNYEIIDYLVLACDHAEYGWGNGKDKKELIAPIVSAICEYAEDEGIDAEQIDTARKACEKELDATFYTDEKVIAEKLKELLEAINEKKKNNPLNKFFPSIKWE